MKKERLYAAIDGTWPAASYTENSGWTIREGQGGGSRVSAATAIKISDLPNIEKAEAAMQALGQTPIFMIRPGEQALDTALADRGYAVKDPVNLYAVPVETLCDIPLPRVTVLPVWEPLAIMREIWAAAGVGPARLAVMHRARGPKTAWLGRNKDKPAGVGFAAIHDGLAMVHAIEILAHQRRAGVAGWMMRASALWARDNGADTIAVLCTKANAGANALYSSLTMPVVGEYHYRILTSPEDQP